MIRNPMTLNIEYIKTAASLHQDEGTVVDSFCLIRNKAY
jgi:hypothetical protein